MPKEVAQNYATIADSRIGQLTNNKDFATASNSLLFVTIIHVFFAI
jgi:hypothetical protein